MSEFFIELFSEEIPANLQNKTRQDFFQNIKEFLEKEEIKYSGDAKAFSIPNRLIVYFQNISKKIIKKKPIKENFISLKNPLKVLKQSRSCKKIYQKF